MHMLSKFPEKRLRFELVVTRKVQRDGILLIFCVRKRCDPCRGLRVNVRSSHAFSSDVANTDFFRRLKDKCIKTALGHKQWGVKAQMRIAHVKQAFVVY